MPTNETDNKDDGIKSSPVYKAIIDRLAEQDAKITSLIKSNEELADFNRALLGGTNETTHDSPNKMADYEKKLDGGLKHARKRSD